MTASTRVQPIDRALVVRLTGTDASKSAMLAEFAREKLAEAEQVNNQALGHVPAHQTYVDGRLGVSEDGVKPNGVIVYAFELTSDALTWIMQQLDINSPVGSVGDPHPGLYEHSHVLYADGVQVDPSGDIPSASEYVFINREPYARKIEAGESSQAPDGVYESLAAMAQSRFGKSLQIRFTFRTPESGELLGLLGSHHARRQHARDTRQPAIVVTVK